MGAKRVASEPPPQPSPKGGGSLSSTRLAIVGASVRAAAQSALRAGFDVVGADLFADADLDGVCPITKIDNYPDGLADWLAEQEVDAWMYTGALENYPKLVDRMAGIAPLWGVSGEPLRRCRDPLAYQCDLFRSHVAYPMTVAAASVESFEHLGQPFLAKTYRHASGAGVERVIDQSSLEFARADNAYLQYEFQSSESYAAIYAVGQGTATLLGVTRQLFDPEENPYAYRGSVGPVQPGEQQAAQLNRLGACLAGSLGLSGLVGVDLVECEDSLSVVEINPRFTASIELLERASGKSAVQTHAAACRGETVEPWSQPSDSVHAKWVVFANREVIITTEFADWLAATGAADRPLVGERIREDQPVCNVFAEGASESEALSTLDRAVRETQDHLYHEANH